MRLRRVITALASLGFVWLAGGTSPSQAAPDAAQAERRASRVANTTMSPFCPGKTIDACPSPRAAEWRQDIRQWSADGLSSDEIRARLQDRVPGFDLSGRPGASWDWALPAGAVALATLWLVWLLRRLRRPGREPEPTVSTAPADALDARLDRELDRHEGGG